MVAERAVAAPVAAPWRMPVVPTDFDRAPGLAHAEREALSVYAARHGRLRTGRALAAVKQALLRFERPLWAVAALRPAPREHVAGARLVLYDAMLRRGRSFWGWSAAEWLDLLQASPAAFRASHGGAARGRMTLFDLAYLLGGVSDLRPAGLARQATATARAVFGAEPVAAAVTPVVTALTGLGFRASPGQCWLVAETLCLALLLNRSPRLADLSPAVLDAVADAPAHQQGGQVAGAVQRLAAALAALGHLAWPTAPPRPDPVDDARASAGVADAWAAWVRAWYHQAVRPGRGSRAKVAVALFAVGRWLRAEHPAVTWPEQWDDALALAYVQAVCTARVGDYGSPRGQRTLALRPRFGQGLMPRTIDRRLGALRRVFTDWQERPHAVDGAPARTIPIRFNPLVAFATPPPVRARIQPDPRDIDLGTWYKLAHAAAHLAAADLARHHQRRYPLTLYRALALLWVTAARRPNELRRLRVGCVRRDWDPAMRDDDGRPLEPAAGELCYLHVPPNKTRGAFWIWIPAYTADAIAAWERERPALQPPRPDPKDGTPVDFLFADRGQPVGERFLNHHLLPLLCAVAGVPEADARGQITAHRGRSTRATLLRKLGVPLGEIADYLGHADETTVRSYARTDDLQLAQIIRRADARSRLVEGLIDVPAAQAGRPNVFFFLGRGPDGKPRYCGNPAWASCPHRLACLKCRMYVGGTVAELLEARDGVLRFQTQVPMRPEEQAAVDGDVARLNERLAELRGVPAPEPPGDAFVFNPAPASEAAAPTQRPSPEGDRHTFLLERQADLREELVAAQQSGNKRRVLVRALQSQIAAVDAELAALDRASSDAPSASEEMEPNVEATGNPT